MKSLFLPSGSSDNPTPTAPKARISRKKIQSRKVRFYNFVQVNPDQNVKNDIMSYSFENYNFTAFYSNFYHENGERGYTIRIFFREN